MHGSKVTRRYARALFELANEKNQLTQVSDDLHTIKDICKRSEDFNRLLESPVIKTSEKRRVFLKLFEKRVYPLTYFFLELLLEKNREDMLLLIIEHFMGLLDESRGIVRGDLQTAFPFTDKQLTSLKERLDHLTGKNVVLDQNVNPGLLGGFIVKLDDTVIDTSLKNQLTKMRESMISGD